MSNALLYMKMPKSNCTNAGRIEKKVMIKATPAIVFEALTNAADLARWFCDRAASNPQEGGELVASWKTRDADRVGRAIFTRIVRNSILELRWIYEQGEDVGEGSRHILSYTIQPKHGGAEVAMRDEDELHLDEEALEAISQGWNGALLELKDHCERKRRSLKTRGEADTLK
jgi:uncharacterized protein YndB with AHSA1/START domain